MGQLKLEGSLLGGPAAVCDGSFPSALVQLQLGFASCGPKQFEAATGVLTRTLASPGALVPLSGCGPSDTVTQGSALYFKCNSDMTLELTFTPPSGPSIVSLLPVNGPLVLETPAATFLTGLRCQGSGPIEYLVVGPQ